MLIYMILQPVKDRPIVVLTAEGENPQLSSVLLNSHTDVVPVFPVSITVYEFVLCISCWVTEYNTDMIAIWLDLKQFILQG